MLKKIQKRKGTARGEQFAIVAAKYNAQYVDSLVEVAEEELRAGKAGEVKVIRVPGSFEIPAVAARLAKSEKFAAIICFGAILRGQTSHAQHIAEGVTNALANLQIATGVPIIHGVLMFENEEQARVRCLGKEHNRGIEAARVAIEMAAVMRQIDQI